MIKKINKLSRNFISVIDTIIVKHKHIKLIIIGFIFLFGLLLRIARFIQDPLVGRDAIHYIEKAKLLTSYNWSDVNFFDSAPLLLWFIKLGTEFGVSFEKSGIICNIFFGSVLILAVYWLTQEIFKSYYISIAASIIVATHPILIFLSCEIQRETLYLFFMTMALASFIHGIECRRYFWWYCGCFWGVLATLSRFEGIEFILFVIPVLCSTIFYRKWYTRVADLIFILISAVINSYIILLILGISHSYVYFGIMSRVIRQISRLL